MDFDSLQDDSASQAIPTPQQAPSTQPTQDFDSLQDDSEKYGTTGQQALAGVEGISRGFLGPLATAAEKHILQVPEEDILGRQQANPWTAGIGEAAGLGAGMLTGTGEAALMTKAGELGLEGLGLAAKASEAATLGSRIGSSAVQQAIEMGVLTAGDETSKLILQDPNTSAESAVVNTGVGTLIGGAFGAGGALISPLWKATAGPKVEEALNAIKSRINGTSLISVPEETASNLATLGIEPSAVQRATLSDNPMYSGWTKDLTRAENNSMLEEREALKQQVAESVVQPLGSNLEDLRVYDNDTAGRDIATAVNTRIENTFKPLWEGMDKRNAEAAMLSTPDEGKISLMDRLRERGVTDYAPLSPQASQFYEAGERILSFNNIADFDKYDTELRNEASKGFRAGDYESGKAASNIRSMLRTYKEGIISDSAAVAEKSGIVGSTEAGENMIAQRNALNKAYAQAEAVRDDLSDHFNINSKNSRDFMKQLSNNMTPEQVLKKFSIKNNMDGARFLEQNFPEAYQEVVKNERRALLKPAINSAKDETPINVNKLNDIIQKTKSGKDSYLKTILPQDFINKAEAGSKVLNQMTTPRDSGTPAGLWGLAKHVGGSAIGAFGWLMGHGPVSSLLVGEMAAVVGKEGPEATKLALIRFLGSKEPINGTGFKAMANFISSVQKSQDMLSAAVKNTIKPGAMVLAASQMPDSKDREKLDKALDKLQKSPDTYAQNQQTDLGHYMQEHQQAVTQTQTRIAQYLQTLKPKTNQPGVLDKTIQPSKADQARYAIAQDIALNPNIILAKIKNGSLQLSDIQDMNAMYPGLHNQMINKLTNEMSSMATEQGMIPYKTRMSMSLFMGQPLDSTMQPMAIQASQMTFLPAQPNQNNPTKPKKVSQQAGKGLEKGAAKYQTSDQAAEADRSDRD
jgi:hypothetical protein